MDVYKPFGCKYCNCRLKYKGNLKKHIKTFHKGSTTDETTNDNVQVHKPISMDSDIVQTMDVCKEFVCKYCKLSFKTNINLSKHLRKYHQETITIVPIARETIVSECNICKKSFHNKYNLRRHKKKIHSDNSGNSDTDNTEKCNIVIDTLETMEPATCIAIINEDNSTCIDIKDDIKEVIVCQVCDKQFNSKRKYELTRHMEKVHFVEITKPIKCCVNDCSKSFNRMHQLRKHLMDQKDAGGHNCRIEKEETIFNNSQEFIQWKEDIEENESIRYTVHRRAHLYEDGSFLKIYECSRSGRYNSKGKGKRSSKTQGTNKIGVYCPSRLEAYFSTDGIVKCKYYKTHLGHETSGENLMHIPIHRRDKIFIVEKIRQGVEIKRILEELRIKGGRSAYIRHKDIMNICKIFNPAYTREKNITNIYTNFNSIGAVNIEKSEQQLIDEHCIEVEVQQFTDDDCIEEEVKMVNENFIPDRDEREEKIKEANTILNRIKSSLSKHTIEDIDEMIHHIKKFDAL